MSSPNADAILKPLESFSRRKSRMEKLFVAAIGNLQQGQLTVNLPSGRTIVVKGRRESEAVTRRKATWNLRSFKALRRMLRRSSIGFAEAYMEGEWDSPDLTRFLELMCDSLTEVEAQARQWKVVKLWNRVQHLLRTNTKQGSKRNIAYHYDLGNDFYEQWLDPSMTYSSALFDEDHTELAAAQENKYRKLAQDLELRPHHNVLEIGCGWGGFAEFAARECGCHITCLTLSHEQLKYAQQRIEQAGLADRVEIRLQDYRDVDGKFDRIVSIEMFEAVGEEHWPVYFDQLRNRLTEEGRAGLQIITIENERFEQYRSGADFIQKYIFPGGMLPSPAKLAERFAAADLTEVKRRTFGLSYARTLAEWQRAFNSRWDKIRRLGYATNFQRMWDYYLCYCEAGFRRGMIDVGHYIIEKRQPV